MSAEDVVEISDEEDDDDKGNDTEEDRPELTPDQIKMLYLISRYCFELRFKRMLTAGLVDIRKRLALLRRTSSGSAG